MWLFVTHTRSHSGLFLFIRVWPVDLFIAHLNSETFVTNSSDIFRNLLPLRPAMGQSPSPALPKTFVLLPSVSNLNQITASKKFNFGFLTLLALSCCTWPSLLTVHNIAKCLPSQLVGSSPLSECAKYRKTITLRNFISPLLQIELTSGTYLILSLPGVFSSR